MTEMTDFLDFADDFDAAGLRATIDLGAVAANWAEMARRSGAARAAAVVKADAYGLGIEDVGETLYRAGARDFFVAVAAEGETLRRFAPDARIFVLSGIWPGMEASFFESDLVPVIASDEQLAFWMATVSERGDHPCALQVDTGFNRLGLTVGDAMALAEDVSRPASFSPVLVMSHLACGDDPANPANRRQMETFRAVAAAFDGIDASLAASAGILLGPDYHFDLTRPGIALYGGESLAAGSSALAPVVTAEARILQIREAAAGEAVSYGGTHVLSRDSRLAIVSAGYADGYPRSLSGAGVPLRDAGLAGAHGAIGGQHVPLIGRVTMDLTIFDVTDLPSGSLAAGDYIQLFGPDIPVDAVARAAGTIGYEILTSMGLRYARRYLEAED